MSTEQEFDLAEGDMRAAERHMDDASRAYLRTLADARDALHDYRVEIEEEREDPKAQAEQEQLEREIRSGKHGAALKELQERIDLDQTTMLDVLSGEDTHWSADGLRDLFGPVLEAAAADADDDEALAEDADGPKTSGPRIDEKGTW